MPTVLEDLERGHRVGSEQNTVEVVRIFRVSELTAAPELQIMEALGQTGIPVYLDAYPLPPDPDPDPDPYFDYRNIAVIDRQGQPDGPRAVLITITYTNDFGDAPPPPPGQNDSADIKQIRFGTSQKTTTVDRDGQPMIMPPPEEFSKMKPTKAEAQVNVAVGVLAFERTESTPPAERMRTFAGRVNSTTVGGVYPAGTLYLAAMDASSNDDSEWSVSYEFHYDPSGWKHNDRWRDGTNKVPPEADDVEFDVLPEANFTLLNLDFSD